MRTRVCIGLVAAAGVAATYAAAATGMTSATVGTLHFAYPSRLAHLDFPGAVLIADYRLSKNSPAVRTGTFPPNGVVFMLNKEPKLQHPIPAATVRFPLSLAELDRSDHHASGQTWELRFRADGAVYWATVWYGTTSSARDRAAIASVLASIRG